MYLLLSLFLCSSSFGSKTFPPDCSFEFEDAESQQPSLPSLTPLNDYGKWARQYYKIYPIPKQFLPNVEDESSITLTITTGGDVSFEEQCFYEIFAALLMQRPSCHKYYLMYENKKNSGLYQECAFFQKGWMRTRSKFAVDLFCFSPLWRHIPKNMVLANGLRYSTSTESCMVITQGHRVCPVFDAIIACDGKTLELSTVNVSGLKPQGEIAGIFGELPFKDLKSLSLANNQIPDLQFISKLESLETLNLQGVAIPNITFLFNCKKLKKLFVRLLSDNERDSLDRVLPNCKIEEVEISH